MNKIFNRIAIASVGLAMALGVGVVASSRTTVEAIATDDTTYTMTLDANSGGSNNVHWTSTTTTSLTWNDVTWTIELEGSANSCGSNKNYVQLGTKINSPTKCTFTTTDFGGKTITKLAFKGGYATGGDPILTATAGANTVISDVSLTKTSQTAEISENCNITLDSSDSVSFTIAGSGGGAFYITSFSVTYNDGVSGETLTEITGISGTPTATTDKKGTTDWDLSSLTATGTLSESGANQDVTKYVTFKANTTVGSTVGSQTVNVTATSKDDGEVNYSVDLTGTVSKAPSIIEITASSITNFGNSYAEREWTSGTISGKIHSYKLGENIQFKASESYMYNSVAVPGPITNITLTLGSGSYSELTLYTDSSVITSLPASGGAKNSTNWSWDIDAEDELTYFYLKSSSSNAKVVSKITITYQEVALVDPTGISLNDSSEINMDTYSYGRRTLSATISPYNANNTTITWATSDSSVVTVDNGVLTAKGVGSATVYARTSNFVDAKTTPELQAGVSVIVTQALYKKATFTPTSTSAATQGDDYLKDGSVALSASSSGQWNSDRSAIQLTSGKDITFTISNYKGMKITGIDLVMSSNGSAGSGGLTVTAGSTEILTIASNTAFSDTSWNGAYDANQCDIYKATTEYVVQDDETIKLAFSATANSLYIHSVAIRYLDYSLETWCQKFLNTITCTGVTEENPNGAIKDASSWDDLGLEFLDLDKDLQDIASNATADESGSVIEQAMARYDLIIRKYGSKTYDDYIERFAEGGINYRGINNIFGSNNNSNNGMVIMIVIISIATLVGVGYLTLRKRKEQ